MVESQQDPLQEWARIAKENAEIEAAQAVLHAVISTAPSIEKFITWLLAGSAAAAALMLANLDGLLRVFAISELRAVILLLLLSTLIGLIGKALSVLIQTQIETIEQVKKRMGKVLDEYGKTEEKIEQSAAKRGQEVEMELSPVGIFALLKPAIPKLLHRWLDKSVEHGMQDRLLGLKRAASLCSWQWLLVVLQLLPAFIALVLAGVTFDIPATSST